MGTNNTRENGMSELKKETIAKLEAYLKSGVEGFFTQALDRCREMKIDVSRVSRTREGAENLIRHLYNY